MGNGKWGMGNGEWGMENREYQRAMGVGGLDAHNKHYRHWAMGIGGDSMSTTTVLGRWE